MHTLMVHAPSSSHTQDGELVQFSEVVGMDKLNTAGPFKVKNCKVGLSGTPPHCPRCMPALRRLTHTPLHSALTHSCPPCILP